jgi:hypothetical protein
MSKFREQQLNEYLRSLDEPEEKPVKERDENLEMDDKDERSTIKDVIDKKIASTKDANTPDF